MLQRITTDKRVPESDRHEPPRLALTNRAESAQPFLFKARSIRTCRWPMPIRDVLAVKATLPEFGARANVPARL